MVRGICIIGRRRLDEDREGIWENELQRLVSGGANVEERDIPEGMFETIG